MKKKINTRFGLLLMTLVFLFSNQSNSEELEGMFLASDNIAYAEGGKTCCPRLGSICVSKYGVMYNYDICN
jgi:hypothetical protein